MVTRLDTIDLTDRELYRRGFPHEIFSILREEAPVWRHPETSGVDRLGGAFWVCSRHADVQSVSRDHARFRSLEGPSLPELPADRQGLMLVSMDPPAHTRLRRLISAGFTPRMTSALESRARHWAATIVERALEVGTCNFVHDVAYQLPMHMIADIVGIPVSDRAWLFDQVNALLQSTDPRTYLDPATRLDIETQMFAYARDLAAEKRRRPADDVWTTLITGEIDQGDGTKTRLREFELDLFFMVLTIAGSETTRNAISSGLVALLEHPDQLARLRAEPAAMPSAVEEILRWSSPVAYFRRTAVADVEIRGVTIAAGDRVSVWYPSANRDAEVFDRPFTFDITRPENPHVAFGGGGIHHCLGANLARREIRVIFEELLARVGEIELLAEPTYSVQGIGNPIVMSLQDVPVRLSPR